jgi:hypothetical protein
VFGGGALREQEEKEGNMEIHNDSKNAEFIIYI